MLIVGCGDLGRRLALRAMRNGRVPLCIVGSAGSAATLRQLGLNAHAVDLDAAVQGADLALLGGHDPIWYLAPPPSSGREDPRMRHFLRALPASPPRRILYVSTTGVYGDCHGEWVDESRPINPQVDRAWRRCDAERQLEDWRITTGGSLVVLRVAGIYGPDKLPLERLRKAMPMVAEDEAPWTNRIHIDDLVRVCEIAMAKAADGALYNVSDGHPGNMRDYFDRVADLYGLPRAPLIRMADAQGQLSAGLLSYLGESRRLDNRRLLQELGIALRYPSLAEGLAACRRNSPHE